MSDDVDLDAALAAAGGGPEQFDAHLDAADAGRLARALRDRADDDPGAVAPLLDALAPLLAVEDRSARLAATKAYLAVAEHDPAAVPVDPLRDRLDDDFYFVRGRAAQALGLSARESGEADPALLARLLNGLTLEREESRERYAGALADVALGDPAALRTMTGDLAEALDDDSELVRYHLTTALAATATAHPERVPVDRVRDRLDDDCPEVRGRAVEALALAGESVDVESEASFVAARARFARGEAVDGVGTRDGIAGSHGEAVTAITTPDGDGCPACGEPLPADAPPFCPTCGGPVTPR